MSERYGCEYNDDSKDQSMIDVLLDVQKQIQLQAQLMASLQAQLMASTVSDKTSVGGNTINVSVGKDIEEEKEKLQWAIKVEILKNEIYQYLVDNKFIIEDKYLEEFRDFLDHLH